MELNVEQCPTCGTELTGLKFKEIQAKLRREDQEQAAKLAKAESAFRLELEKQFKRQADARELEIRQQAQQELEKEKLAAQTKANKDVADQIKRAATEHDELAKQLKEAQRREAETGKATAAEIEKQKKIAELKAKAEAVGQINKLAVERDQAAAKAKQAEAREAEIRKGAAQEIEKQKQAAEAKAKAEVADQIKKLGIERDQATAKAEKAEKREADARKQITEDAEKERTKELATQRLALETDKKLTLLKQQAEFNRERESLQKKMQLMDRQLQKKTANELGDGPEIDLYEALREAFPTDKTSRVPKGQAGADILHEVLYKGIVCGKIVLDSKNRQGWQDSYVTKLRQDQVNAEAEHAILATTVFPAGKKEMCIESDVIVISPARVEYIVRLLRTSILSMHVRGLSMKERATKMARLYKLITSESYSRKLAEASKLTEELLELDVQEKRTHDNVWKKRGTLAKRAQNVLREAETELAAVIESTDVEEMPPAFGVKSARILPVSSQVQEMN